MAEASKPSWLGANRRGWEQTAEAGGKPPRLGAIRRSVTNRRAMNNRRASANLRPVPNSKRVAKAQNDVPF
jgi:hypothetical protein